MADEIDFEAIDGAKYPWATKLKGTGVSALRLHRDGGGTYKDKAGRTIVINPLKGRSVADVWSGRGARRGGHRFPKEEG